MTKKFTQVYVVSGIRDEQKRNLLQRARAFASHSISAAELEEARLGELAGKHLHASVPCLGTRQCTQSDYAFLHRGIVSTSMPKEAASAARALRH